MLMGKDLIITFLIIFKWHSVNSMYNFAFRDCKEIPETGHLIKKRGWLWPTVLEFLRLTIQPRAGPIVTASSDSALAGLGQRWHKASHSKSQGRLNFVYVSISPHNATRIQSWWLYPSDRIQSNNPDVRPPKVTPLNYTTRLKFCPLNIISF